MMDRESPSKKVVLKGRPEGGERLDLGVNTGKSL